MRTPSEIKVLQQFAINVKVERHKMGLSQEALADLAELHRTYIGDVERSRRNIGLLNIVRLAKALKITPASLLKGL